MIWKFFIGLFIALFLNGCNNFRQQKQELVYVDIVKSYPEKELILQDLFDIEYVPLETTDEFLTYGRIQSVGKKYILSANRGGDGDLFLFDRKTGKGVNKINRLGQGGEEYASPDAVVLDEANRELFVVDLMTRKIRVYDYEGNFKRDFAFPEEGYYTEVLDYDHDHLLCYLGYMPGIETERSAHVLVSKRDGTIARTLALPYGAISSVVFIDGELTVTPQTNFTAPFGQDWVIMRTSSDTIYRLSDGQFAPFIVRQPSIHTMERPESFLYPYLFTSRYYFMQVQEKSLDLKTFKGFPTIDLVYDSEEQTIYKYTLFDANFQEHAFSFSILPNKALNPELVACFILQADVLLEALNDGKLSGPLKEIASRLNEEDNPVLVMVSQKR